MKERRHLYAVSILQEISQKKLKMAGNWHMSKLAKALAKALENLLIQLAISSGQQKYQMGKVMARRARLEPVTYETLKRIAYIVGGGAEKAIEAFDSMKSQGKEPSLWFDRKHSTWVVQHDKSFETATA